MGLSASQARMLSLTSRMSDLELRAQSIANAKVRLSDQSEGASKVYSDALDKQILKVYTGTSSNGVSTYAEANLKNLTTYGTLSTTDKFRYLKTSSGKVALSQQLAKLIDTSGSTSNPTHTVVPLATFLANCKNNGLIVDDTLKTSSDVVYYTKIWQEVSSNGYMTADGDNPTSSKNENNSEWLQSQISAGNLQLYEWDAAAGTSGTGDYINFSWTAGDSTLVEDIDDKDTAKAEAAYEATMASIESKDKRFDVQLNTINTEHSAVQTEMESVKKIIQKNIERTLKVFDA